MAVTTGDGFIIPIGADDRASKVFAAIGGRAGKLATRVGVAGIAINQSLELVQKGMRAANRVFDLTVGNFGSYEKALIGVGKTTDLAGKQLNDFGRDIQDLAEIVPTTSIELLKIAETAGQLGVEGAKNLTLFSETIAKLDAATSDFGGQEAATSLTRILGLTDEGVENVDRLAASIVQLGNNFKTTEGPIAKTALEVSKGIALFEASSAQIVGIAAALNEMGVRAELSRSVLGRSFREISASIADGGKEFELLQKLTKLTGDQLKETFEKDSVKVFEMFIRGLNRVRGSQGAQGVVDVLGQLNLKGDELLSVLPSLAKNVDVLSDALNQSSIAYRENTALNEEAAKAFAGLSSNSQELLNSITNVATNFGALFAPAVQVAIEVMKDFVSVASDVVNGIQDMMDSKELAETMRELGKSLLNAALGLTALAIAFKLAAVGWGLFQLAATTSSATMSANMAKLAFSTKLVTAQLWLQVKALGATAGAWALAALKITAAAIAFATIAISIDIIVRNFDKMSKLTTTLGGAFVLMGIKVKQVFLNIILLMQKARFEADEFGLSFGIGTKEGLFQAAKAARDTSSDLLKLKKEEIQVIEDLKEASKDLDFGIAGKIAQGIQDIKDVSKGDDKKGPKPTDEQITELTTNVESKIGLLFDDSQLELIKQGLGEGAAGMAGAANSMLQGALGMAGAMIAVLDATQMLIDLGPQILEKIAKIFTSLTELPQKILEGFVNIFDAITGFISNFIPNIINMVDKLIMAALDFLVEGLPDAFLELGNKIPEFLQKLVDRLPEMAFKFGQSLILFAPTMALKLITGLVKGMPRVVEELVKSAPLIAEELVNGMIFALKSFANDLANLLGFDDIFNLGEIEELVGTMGDSISRSASQLFEVIDLEAAARGLDVADRIRNAISSSINAGANILQRLWEALVAIWVFVRDQILMPIFNFLKSIWDTALGVFGELVTAFGAIWQFALDMVVWPLINGLTAVITMFVDKVVAPLLNGLTAIFDFVVTNIIDALSAGFGFVEDMTSAVADLFLKPDWLTDLKVPTPSWVNKFADAVEDITTFGGFSTGGLVTGAKSAVKGLGGKAATAYKSSPVGKATSSIGLATGGIVPGGETHNGVLYAANGALAQGTDTVPAMLTPGEFVINREATKKNLGLLSFINQSGGTVAPVQGQSTVNIVVNTTSALTPQQIRREVVPTIEQEIKRKSQEGSFVISKRGIR